MLRRRFTASFGLAALGALVLTSTAAAEVQVPFHGVLEGHFTNTLIPGTPPTALVVAMGTGEATQLGHFRFDFPLTVNTTDQTGDGTYTFVAANGDVVVADVAAESKLLPSGLRHVEETGVFNPAQCTGRFAGATGGYISERFLDRATGEVIGFFEGTISFPGAGKP